MPLKELKWSAFSGQPPEALAQALASNPGAVLRCGYIPPHERTAKQDQVAAAIVGAMPRFGIRGRQPLKERKYLLWEARRKVIGSDKDYINQVTGSCVGAGGGNMLVTLQCVEIALGEPESYRRPWWLFTYGKSRQRAGLNGQGDGSFGAAWAAAVKEDGFFELDPAGLPDLPDYQEPGGWIRQTSAVELKWSDGKAIGAQWLAEGKKHLVKTVARAKDHADVLEGLAAGYPATMAGMFGMRSMVPRPAGNPPVRLGQWDGEWAHQQSIQGVWDHPSLGIIFYIMNQWGADAHGTPLAGEPPGGYWVPKTVIDRMCRDEVFIFSAQDGYPSRELLWSAF